MTELYDDICKTLRSSYIALSRECSENFTRGPCSRRDHTLNLFVCDLPKKVASPLYKSTVDLFVSFAKIWRWLPATRFLFLTDYYRTSFPYEESTSTQCCEKDSKNNEDTSCMYHRVHALALFSSSSISMIFLRLSKVPL